MNVRSICKAYFDRLLAESPLAIINTLWLSFTTGFGMRGRQEHLTLLWGDVEIKFTSEGDKYLEFTERATKTRNGLTGTRPFAPKIVANPGKLMNNTKLKLSVFFTKFCYCPMQNFVLGLGDINIDIDNPFHIKFLKVNDAIVLLIKMNEIYIYFRC